MLYNSLNERTVSVHSNKSQLISYSSIAWQADSQEKQINYLPQDLPEIFRSFIYSLHKRKIQLTIIITRFTAPE